LVCASKCLQAALHGQALGVGWPAHVWQQLRCQRGQAPCLKHQHAPPPAPHPT
jgi:hypothetical protein